ncbi:porin family protein [Mongoliitalea lutea]|uniref:Outer membrane protein beta-barrel domain-containing protein n=1 Tax=Mongoliitalea lutea TaxID=849756 RepID=A0A8J3CWK3_9BACT|nr:porin family protein [Mongoliitalea lutea]GHB35125.1 hypothetical protein GCM10008106_15640 [Mongoliitalea lutea]
MKKLLLLLILSTVGMQANAQFGVRAGANVSNINQFAFANRVGIHLGGYYTYDWKEDVILEAGIYFNQKGYNDQKNTNVSDFFNYISIPVLARYKFLDQFNVFAGPQAHILSSRKRNENGTISKTTMILRGYDLSALAGVGMDLPQGINVQIAYDYGLISINYFDFIVKNRSLQLSVGKRF